MLSGKGMFVWQIPRCGQAQQIADLAALAGFNYVLIKVADGTGAYHGEYDNPTDYVTPLVEALRANQVQPVGWHYVYGANPAGEAAIALQRIRQYSLRDYVLDAEKEYKGRNSQAAQFMAALRDGAPEVSFGLSSYRFPTLHPELPWAEFRAECDYDAPQVYWQSAHNPGAQLRRCVTEFGRFKRQLPLIPTGAAYREHGWEPTAAEVIEFIQTARELGLGGINYWELYDALYVLPAAVWEAITGSEQPEPPEPPAPVDRVAVNVDMLNLRNAPVVSAGTVIGYAPRESAWTVTGRVRDDQGRTWVQSGPTAHLAEWLTRPIVNPPSAPTHPDGFELPVGTDAERASNVIWPGDWFDALPYLYKNAGSYHTGADLNLNKPTWNSDAGAPVHAISAGQVIFVGVLPDTWGTVIVIRHAPLSDGTPVYSRCAHLASVAVSAGDQVSKGQQVGTIGTMPGYPGRDHLHFDISCTDILADDPGHWPGADRASVIANYVDPKLFLQAHREGS